MKPAFAGAGLKDGNRFTFCKEPENVREIDAGSDRKGMPAPDSGIDVENLEAAVPRILLELDFGETGETSCDQEALGCRDDMGLVYGFDEGAELAEVLGVLPKAAGRDGGEGEAVFAESGNRRTGSRPLREPFPEGVGFREE